MRDWNIVITLRGHASRTLGLLRRLGLGPVAFSRFLDVLVMKVDDPRALLEQLDAQAHAAPDGLPDLSRVTPCDRAFTFRTPEEFEAKAADAVAGYAPALAGKSFHVRVHRRGFKGRLASHDEERRLGARLYESLERAGTPARVRFEDPDAVVVVETVGTQAGTALVAREDRDRYPFLRPE